MKVSVPTVLSFGGGFVDTVGFLALHGLFTAHVTGNFVTLGATAITGVGGAVAKLAALPVFCLAVLASRLVARRSSLRGLLAAQTAFLAAGAACAVAWGPFRDGDSAALFVTGMLLVAAMGIQNAVHRMYFASAPPTTLMTGSTTQVVLDLADLIRGSEPPAPLRARMRRLSTAVLAFALGCGAAAVAYWVVACAAFVIAPVLGAVAIACSATASKSEPG